MRMKKMKKTTLTADFRETVLPLLPKGDKPALREAWNNYTDALCKNGVITQFQYDTWTNPFDKSYNG